MYEFTQEVYFDGEIYKAGDKIEKPTRRMIELGLVKISPKPETIEKPVKAKKPKKKKVEKIEEIKLDDPAILTEVSDQIEVSVETAEVSDENV